MKDRVNERLEIEWPGIFHHLGPILLAVVLTLASMPVLARPGQGNGQMNGRGNGQMNGQDNGQGNGQMNGQGNNQMGQGNGQMNGQGNGQMNGQGNGQANGQGNGQMNGQGNGQGNVGGYQQTNLVSDQSGVAILQDTNLVNAWGMSFGPNTPFWISDNGSGLATLYVVTNAADGTVHVTNQTLRVTIPGDGTPTGQLFNNTTAFHTNLFIFASEDGTISGWRPSLGTTAEVLVARSNAVYKGITLATNSGKPVLLVANFREGTVDAYDTNLSLLDQFSDTNAPDGYAPFNVASVAGQIFVTFAKQDDAKHDDVAGAGNGLIDVFNPQTGSFRRFVTGKDAGGKLMQINSPWGVVVSPAGFGAHGDQLLVGNFGAGTIMSFDADGTFEGLLNGQKPQPIVIDGLWALVFGNGNKAGRPSTLFFTAGPDKESHGLFGSLDPIPNTNPGRGQANGHPGN